MIMRTVSMMLALACFSSAPAAEGKPRVAIIDFSATGVSEEDASIVTEIFRSKIITSCVFDVLERKNLKNIIAENNLALSGLVDQPGKIGELLGAEYLITGSFMKMGKKLMITVNLIRVETGKIAGTSEMVIDNMDSVYDSITLLTARLIKSSFGMRKFTFSTETEGFSLVLGANALTDFGGGRGFGFTVGHLEGKGRFWGGYSTTWNFTNIEGNNPDFGSKKKLIGCFGSGNALFGNKVEGAALLLAMGAGYDFQGGILVIPSAGVNYKNTYFKFSKALIIDPSGDSSVRNYSMFEIGYSIFFGTYAKEAVYFK